MINIPIVNIITNSSDRNEEKDCEIKLMMIESESNDYIDNIIRCKNHFPALWKQKMSNYETAKFMMNRLATIQIKEFGEGVHSDVHLLFALLLFHAECV